jgi:hypothetical protein
MNVKLHPESGSIICDVNISYLAAYLSCPFAVVDHQERVDILT